MWNKDLFHNRKQRCISKKRMPKISKIKFRRTGVALRRTTASGDMEMMLQYNVADDHFFFDREEIRKFFPEYNHDIHFKECDTARKAIAVVKAFIGDNTTKTRMLRIKLGVPEDLCPSPVGHLKEMTSSVGGFYKARGVSLQFERVLKIETDEGISYAECDQDWKMVGQIGVQKNSLIEWSEDNELFLVGVQQQMDKLCMKVLEFFDTPSVEELVGKMTNKQLTISSGEK